MKAYYYCSIFKKDSIIHSYQSVFFGTFLAENQNELKKKVIESETGIKLIENGYTLVNFECGLIPHYIAPINCTTENT